MCGIFHTMVYIIRRSLETCRTSYESSSIWSNFIPTCVVNFVLRLTADLFETDDVDETAEFVRRNFYVDDGITTVPSRDIALELYHSSQSMCGRGGFNLHHFCVQT